MDPDPAVIDYWRRHYFDGACSICGNRGWFDTRGTRSTLGALVGRVHYCICPNGQRLRQSNFPITPDGADHSAH